MRFLILLHFQFIFCTVDLNLPELQYLADHLRPDECRFLVAALHFKSYEQPNALEQAEEKVSKDIPCLRLLLHWNSAPGEGRGETHEAVQHRLRQLGRNDLADWLGKTVFHELGEEMNRKFDIRCPIILPGNNEVVKLLIRKAHETALHVGVQTVQHLLRHKFWVLKGKRAERSVITSCAICRRFSAKKATVESIPIPEDRVRTVAPFQVTGVDLAGPMYLRGRKKVWIVLYTCAVYRAVQLELIHSLSTEGFLRSLRRFIARRARPATIYSDNSLNFVGCNNLFRQVDWNKVQRHVTISKITWKFKPPTAA
ncbi:hypothetical protein ILUMI_11669 [Ignelater luminosus]|uniref:Integrase zinc-binding domain-containing protein n=1 Tax=Ignelater luminosus TaxID=2038154 RepID=A0A8K0GDQ5_IGNLU|nr:hypothetical protein ILUMI_11669 [Ignelater luminosus]